MVTNMNWGISAVYFTTIAFATMFLTNGWVVEPRVYTIYRLSKTWNEAREICHLNNNTLLTIPDNNMWQFWIQILEPSKGPQHRSISAYWFGLHAPNPSVLTSHKWDDCASVTWYEWTESRQNYKPNHPCLVFDTYFTPFTNVLMKLWRSDSCSNQQQFVCSEKITGSCVTYGCDEIVQEMTKSECDVLCGSDTDCRSRFLDVEGLKLCHKYSVATSANPNFYRICHIPQGSSTITTCATTNWNGDTSYSNTDTNPGGECNQINTEITSNAQTTLTAVTSSSVMTTTAEDKTTTTTTETAVFTTTTKAIVTTTLSSTKTVTSGLCICPCAVKSVDDLLTIEEKVQQLKKELTVNKKNTSLHKRKFISVADNRPSATGIGSVGVVILVSVLVAIFLMDIGTFKSDLTTMFFNVKSRFTGKSVSILRQKESINHPNSTQIHVRRNDMSVKNSIANSQRTDNSNSSTLRNTSGRTSDTPRQFTPNKKTMANKLFNPDKNKQSISNTETKEMKHLRNIRHANNSDEPREKESPVDEMETRDRRSLLDRKRLKQNAWLRMV